MILQESSYDVASIKKPHGTSIGVLDFRPVSPGELGSGRLSFCETYGTKIDGHMFDPVL